MLSIGLTGELPTLIRYFKFLAIRSSSQSLINQQHCTIISDSVGRRAVCEPGPDLMSW